MKANLLDISRLIFIENNACADDNGLVICYYLESVPDS